VLLTHLASKSILPEIENALAHQLSDHIYRLCVGAFAHRLSYFFVGFALSCFIPSRSQELFANGQAGTTLAAFPQAERRRCDTT
jgi:hypothetical protein